MKKIFALLLILNLVFQGCDDGDIIVTTFNFNDLPLKTCGDVGNYVFYKENTVIFESISLKLGTSDSIYNTEGTRIYQLGENNVVNYRRYDGALGNNYFCSSIPPTSPKVLTDYVAVSGTAEVTILFEYDDLDNIPADKEFDGDTDGDGIPDFYDFDDDGDNVPTALELDTENLDSDDDPLTNFKDTDQDGIPDYLDPDDDGDGILTRNEDRNMDLDPTNDVSDPAVGADYLNPAVAVNTTVNEYRQHRYTIKKSIHIVLKNVVMVSGEEKVIQETLDLGAIENVETVEVLRTPAFPL